jgi:hypothetical protein
MAGAKPAGVVVDSPIVVCPQLQNQREAFYPLDRIFLFLLRDRGFGREAARTAAPERFRLYWTD